MAFGVKTQTGNAFLYCISDAQIHTIVIDRRKMTIGNSPSADICLGQEWIGKKLVEFSKQGRNGYCFQVAHGYDVWFNGEYQKKNAKIYLADRDAVLIRSKGSQEWLLFWFRMDPAEMNTKWDWISFLEAESIIPMTFYQGQYWIYPGSSENRTFVNKTALNEPMPVYVGMTVQAGCISGVIASGLFLCQTQAGRYFDSSASGSAWSPSEAPNEQAGSSYRSSGDALYEQAYPSGVQPGRSAASAGSGTLAIDIEERTVGKLLGKRAILRDIHIDVHGGQMVLILGGSGAGKTTFMNAVIGFEKAVGSIIYDGNPLDELRRRGSVIGFVPQKDILRQGDTVGKTIRNAAEMKLPESVLNDHDELNRRIRHTLELMSLREKEKELVSKLSGGEKKRLSVATEYIGNPMLFFLDEPDSGLDGAQAEKLMNVLRMIADEGRIVMIISHSPDRAYSLYDKVIVLAKNPEKQCGELAFYGTADRALQFFGQSSLEGIMKALGIGGDQDHSKEFIMKYQSYSPGRDGIQ